MSRHPDDCLGQGPVPFCHCSVPPLAQSTPAAFTGVALGIGGLSGDTPRDGHYPLAGTKVGTILHCEAWKHTSLGAFRFEKMFLMEGFDSCS